MQPNGSGQVEDREAILQYIRCQLIGPVDGEHELVLEPPHRRYLTGILFPTEADADESLQDDIQDDVAGDVPGDVYAWVSGETRNRSVGASRSLSYVVILPKAD